jgi:3-oxoacyl-[acyl-carrier-protein] synthase II
MKLVDDSSNKKIAIIGMACKFPGANDIDEFWDVLKNGKETVSHFSSDQLRENGIPEDVIHHPSYVSSRGILNNLDSFDTSLFKISSADLETLNLQTKIFLMLTWKALEDAGISPKACPKRTSVYTGSNDSPTSCPAGSLITTMHGLKEFNNSRSLAPFISYKFGLQGAALNLYTACSTSLVAVIKACEDLYLNNSDIAIAGGAYIDIPQVSGYFYEKDGILSSDGKCRAFDAKASGSVLSNGAGVVILKRLNDALRDKDTIQAVIEGYATNNDGNLKAGYLAPGINGQYYCIKSAWDNSGIDPSLVDYIEAHGSATMVGDPIEYFALKKAFQGFNLKENQCGIGSVKTNIGHTAIASGMAALIKSVLILKNRAIVPSLHFDEINQNINITNSPFYIATKYQEFPKDKKNIIVGVSNFGFGGTNAHLILKNRI